MLLFWVKLSSYFTYKTMEGFQIDNFVTSNYCNNKTRIPKKKNKVKIRYIMHMANQRNQNPYLPNEKKLQY